MSVEPGVFTSTLLWKVDSSAWTDFVARDHGDKHCHSSMWTGGITFCSHLFTAVWISPVHTCGKFCLHEVTPVSVKSPRCFCIYFDSMSMQKPHRCFGKLTLKAFQFCAGFVFWRTFDVIRTEKNQAFRDALHCLIPQQKPPFVGCTTSGPALIMTWSHHVQKPYLRWHLYCMALSCPAVKELYLTLGIYVQIFLHIVSGVWKRYLWQQRAELNE